MASTNTIRDKSGYKEIAKKLRLKIEQGHWPTGMMIPSRKTLTQEYQAGMGTIQSAVSLLVMEGLLQTDDRRGTFVSQTSADQSNTQPPYISNTSVPLITSATMGILCRFGLGGSDGPISQIQDDWHHNILLSMEKYLSQEQCSTRFFNYYRKDGPWVPIEDAVAALIAQGVSAITAITIHSDPEEVNDIFSAVGKHGLPLVFISANALHRPVPHIFYDNTYGGYMAAQHLIERGYHDLVFVVPVDADWVSARLTGVRQAVSDAGLNKNCLRVVEAEESLNYSNSVARLCGYQVGKELFGANKSRFGVIAANDHTAFGLLDAAAEAQRVAGEHFGIISFDDLPESRMLGLTSLRPPLEEMGEAAAQLMVSTLRGQDMTTQVCLRSHLLARSSTGAPARVLSHHTVPVSKGVSQHDTNTIDLAPAV